MSNRIPFEPPKMGWKTIDQTGLVTVPEAPPRRRQADLPNRMNSGQMRHSLGCRRIRHLNYASNGPLNQLLKETGATSVHPARRDDLQDVNLEPKLWDELQWIG